MSVSVPDLTTIKFYVDWNDDGFTAGDVVTPIESASITIGALGGGRRVANVGTLTATLDNSTKDFSPNNTGGAHYGTDWINLPVQMVVNDGVGDITIFTGKTVGWFVDSNLYGDRKVFLMCVDLMEDFQRTIDLALIMRADQTADQLLKLVGSAVFRTGAADIDLTFTSNAQDGDTATVGIDELDGEETYTFKNTPASAYDVQIGASTTETAANFAQAVNGDPAGIGSAFYTGTFYHLFVTATSSSNVATVTARSRGAWGNSIRVSVSAGTPTPRFSWDVAGFTGGVDGPAVTLNYDTGIETFDYACDQWVTGETNGITAIEEIVQSEWGWFGVDRTGEPVFKNRQYQFLVQASSSVTVDNTQSALLNPRMDRNDIVNRTVVLTTPRRELTSGTIGTAPSAILVPGTTGSERWNGIDPAGPAGTVSIKVPFKDQTSGRQIAALRIDPLIAGTHYDVNEAADGTGTDYTTDGSLTLSYIITATHIEITFINTAFGPLYVLDLYVVGTGLVAFDEQQIVSEDTTSISSYGQLEKPIALPLPMSNVFPETLANYITDTKKDPLFLCDGADYDAPGEAATSHLLNIELFDVITISDDQTDIDANKYIVTGANYEFSAGDVSRVALFGERIDSFDYWILGAAGSQLGTNTRLGL